MKTLSRIILIGTWSIFLSIMMQSCGRVDHSLPIFETVNPADSSQRDGISKEEATQKPAEFFSGNIKVVVRINGEQPYAYLDLDSFSSSGEIQSESDIALSASYGTDLFIILKPINHASVYWNEDNIMDYSYCNGLVDKYSDKSFPEVLSGIPFCLLTNNGSIASMKYIKIQPQPEDPQNIEIIFDLLLWK